MKASEQEIVVHEISLDAAESLSEEPFLAQGEGSFFVSRVSELVLIKPTNDGLARLPDKVGQLVGRGLHHVIVSLASVGELESDALRVLMQVTEVLERCVGSLRLCDVDPGVDPKLRTLGITDSLKILGDRDEAVRDYKASAGGNSPAEATTQDESNDWGWGSNEELAEPEGPSVVPVAELLVEDAELSKLLKEVKQIVTRSEKTYVSLRLHFGRQITSEDMTVLTSCRDYLAGEGGQLVLVALQTDVSKWLKLLEFDREFVIAETADEADLAHRRHAAGEAVGPAPKATAPAVETPAPAGTTASPSVDFESDVSLAVEGAPSSAELEALASQASQAKSEAAQLRAKLSQLRDVLKRAEEGQAQADRRAKELGESLRRDERRLRELEQSRERADERVKSAEADRDSNQADSQRLEGEVRSLRQQLDESRANAKQGGESGQRLAELERVNQGLREDADRLRAAASTVGSSTNGGDDDTQALRARFQEEKARILTEAEEEIRRLSDEQEMLREELQSAGEMIERLGKELELS